MKVKIGNDSYIVNWNYENPLFEKRKRNCKQDLTGKKMSEIIKILGFTHTPPPKKVHCYLIKNGQFIGSARIDRLVVGDTTKEDVRKLTLQLMIKKLLPGTGKMNPNRLVRKAIWDAYWNRIPKKTE